MSPNILCAKIESLTSKIKLQQQIISMYYINPKSVSLRQVFYLFDWRDVVVKAGNMVGAGQISAGTHRVKDPAITRGGQGYGQRWQQKRPVVLLYFKQGQTVHQSEKFYEKDKGRRKKSSFLVAWQLRPHCFRIFFIFRALKNVFFPLSGRATKKSLFSGFPKMVIQTIRQTEYRQRHKVIYIYFLGSYVLFKKVYS